MTSVWKIKTFLFLIVTTDITPSIKPLKKTINLFDEFFNFLYERIPAINKNEKIENKVKTLVVSNLDNKILSAMIEPFGFNANLYYTEYWTVYEQNENKLPWEKWVILNRVVWSAVSALIFYSIYAKFDFHQQPIRIKWPWKKEKTTQKEGNDPVIKKLTLPKVNLNFGLSNQLKQLWLITISDLKYIIKGFQIE